MTRSELVYKTLVVVGLGAVIAVAIAFVNFDGDPEVDACIERGEKHFREIGSWPTLQGGRDAKTVVEERCQRQPKTAF